MKLVIVESPNKCKTIARYLGEGYLVMASKGHLRDLAKSGVGRLGVDIRRDFKPDYKINSDKYRIVNELRSAAKKSTEVILATDPDREGEAIAWHIAMILGLDPAKAKRLEFHEITRASIEEALRHPRTIDINLVHAQEARRIMDRIIGFEISGLLQKKIRSRSGGRVQSATLKLISDHEKKIRDFVPQEFWTIRASLAEGDKKLTADYYGIEGRTTRIKNGDECREVLRRMGQSAELVKLTSRLKYIESRPPFTTSTLQQEASNIFHFPARKTASLAQELYEGSEVNGEHVGLITYIRTDSTHLADSFVEKARDYIRENFGEEYLGGRKTGKKVLLAQNAHEAIRPTDIRRTPRELQPFLTPDLYKLYKLIYERAVGSLMKARKERVTTALFSAHGVSLKSEGRETLFDGYARLYQESGAQPAAKSLPPLAEGEIFTIESIDHEQRFTEKPKEYSEGQIVKLMEDKGIGRPSTYASTISTLLLRKYVVTEKGLVVITAQGEKTSDFLVEYFPTLVDASYTAGMESNLDKIERGVESKSNVLNAFYHPFIDHFKKVTDELANSVPTHEEVGKCPVCSSPLVRREGRNGSFIGCSNYPKCRYVRREENEEKTGESCPLCGAPLVVKHDRRGRRFIGCSNYPNCNYVKRSPHASFTPEPYRGSCPKCGGKLFKKHGPYGFYVECENYPKCDYRRSLRRRRYAKGGAHRS